MNSSSCVKRGFREGAKRDSTNITPRQKAAYVLGEAADVQDVELEVRAQLLLNHHFVLMARDLKTHPG
jgi:hypothetical protein